MIETLKKTHADSMLAVQMAEQALEESRRTWKEAIANGGDDAALDQLEINRMKLERTTERRRVAEQAAHDAVVQAEQAEQERERKAAANAFLTANHGLTAKLQDIDEAAKKFLSLVQELPEDGGAWAATMMRAKQLGALPTVAPLPVPADCIAAAKRAANYPGFLQSRMH